MASRFGSTKIPLFRQAPAFSAGNIEWGVIAIAASVLFNFLFLWIHSTKTSPESLWTEIELIVAGRSAAMEAINQIMNFSESMLERLTQLITPINSTTLAASVIVLSVLFAGPNRLATILETFAVAMLGLALILFAPNYVMALFVIGYILVGIARSRFRSALLQEQLRVAELTLQENRRIIGLLNSPSPFVIRMQQQHAPSILPSEQIDGAGDSSELHVASSNLML